MSDRSYGTVVRSGMATKSKSGQDRRGPGGKNLGPSRVGRPNPAPTIRSTGQQVKGPDKGAGTS